MSFEKAKKWVKDLEDKEASEPQKFLKFLVGNKSDMVSEVEVQAYEGEQYAKEIDS